MILFCLGGAVSITASPLQAAETYIKPAAEKLAAELNLNAELGPIREWRTVEGRVSAVQEQLEDITPLSHNWFLELVSAEFPDLKHVIMDSENGIISIGNASCAFGSAEQAGETPADVFWSVCGYKIDGVFMFSSSSVSVAKNARLTGRQNEFVLSILQRSLQVPESFSTEPIEIK